MPRHFHFLTALLLTLAAAPALLAADPPASAPAAYPIKINRPSKTGDTYTLHLIVEGSTTSVLHPPTGPDRTSASSFAADLTAAVQVAAVDSFGREKNFSLTISSLSDHAGQKPMLPPGTVIDVARTAKDITFKRHDGEDLPPVASDALGHLFEKLTADYVSDDMAFGSHEPRRVGDSWSINESAAAQDAANQDVKIDPRNISGTVRLDQVDTVAGIPVLHISNTSHAVDQKPPVGQGISVEHSDFTSNFKMVVPIDPALPQLSTELTEAIHLNLTNSAAPGATMNVTIKYDRKQEITPGK